MTRCECDFDCAGDPLAYVKTSRNVCPVHDPCESCQEPGARRTKHGWYCPECEEIDADARVLAAEYYNGARLESLDARWQQDLWQEAESRMKGAVR